jgi:hypothetical protein
LPHYIVSIRPPFGELVSILDRTTQFTQKDSELIFLNYPITFKNLFVDKIWKKSEGFDEIIINHVYPQLRMDLMFMFIVYSQHKVDNFPVNKFNYGCWNGGLFTKEEAHYNHGPFDSCASVNIPDFFYSPLKDTIFFSYEILYLNGRKQFVKR